MLFPKKTKYRKIQKGRFDIIDISLNNPTLGFYGIKSLVFGRITSQQIESIRKMISRKIQKFGFMRLKIFPFLSITKKPVETRMGKGKGSFSFWCFPIKPGRILIEFYGVSYNLACDINRLVNSKLCLKTKLVKNI